MSAKLFAFTCGSITGLNHVFLENTPGRLTVPVPAYLIEHPQGRVLFDTGINIGVRQEAMAMHGDAADAWEIDLPDGLDIVSHLAQLGLEPRDIRYVVNSHLHYDHCGGNHAFPDATFVVHAREWRAAHLPSTQAAGIYVPANFAGMTKVQQIGGALDLFGDGTVVIFPTPGHTPGHQSLRVMLEGGPVVLAADCCYLKRTLDALHLPADAYNREQMLQSLAALRAEQAAGARIFFGHDPDFWREVPQGPRPVG